MSALEAVFLWTALGLYVGSFLSSLLASLFRFARAEAVTRIAWPAGLSLHLLAGIARWVATGHAPVMYAYENSLAGSFFVGLIFFILALRFPPGAAALPAVLAAMILILGNGLMAPAVLAPLEPPFRSGWLAVHVLFAWIAFGSFLVAAVLAGLYLKAEGRREAGPNPSLLEDTSGRLVTLGFAADTVMIASGAIWAHGLWGRYWGWDPVETWSLLTWLTYGANLHLRFTLGWRGRRAAWLTLVSIASVVVTFFGIGVVSDVHTQLLR